MVLNQANTWFLVHEEKLSLRGEIGDIWEPIPKLSPRFTYLWHSTSQERQEAYVLLESGHIDKLATLQVPSIFDPGLARKLCLHSGDMYLVSCISLANY